MLVVEKLKKDLNEYFDTTKRLTIYLANDDSNLTINCHEREILIAISESFKDFNIIWNMRENLYGKILSINLQYFSEFDSYNFDKLMHYYKIYFKKRIDLMINNLSSPCSEDLDFHKLVEDYNCLINRTEINVDEYSKIRARFQEIYY